MGPAVLWPPPLCRLPSAPKAIQRPTRGSCILPEPLRPPPRPARSLTGVHSSRYRAQLSNADHDHLAPNELVVRLRFEAASHQMSVARLVHDLLDVIVTDNLTAAILDN